MARLEETYHRIAKGIALVVLALLLVVAHPTAYFIDFSQLQAAAKGAPIAYFKQRVKEFLSPPTEVVEVAAVGQWMRENLPAESTIALEDIGMVPYYSGFKTIDAFGLTDPHIAHLPGLMHQKHDIDYILSRKPDYILLHVWKNFVGGFPSDRAMMASPEFQHHYGWHSTHLIESGTSYLLIFERQIRGGDYQVVKDFIADFPEATVKYYQGGKEQLVEATAMDQRFVNTGQTWFIKDERRTVLYEHPYGDGSTAIVYGAFIPASGAFLKFSTAIDSAAWFLSEGDGALFEIYLANQEERVRLLSWHIDPIGNPEDRKWYDFEIDVSPFSGKEVEISFETSPGPAGNTANDWAGWGNPMLIQYP